MTGTALEWYDTQIWALQIRLEKKEICLGEYEVKKAELFKQAKEMEEIQDSKRLLFAYKVSLIIGLEKTGKLLKEVEKEIKQQEQ
jgi:hypothetical protein